MKLRKLHIDDYKMFKDFDIKFVDENQEPKSIIVLIGINGSGKTTLLKYIYQFQKMVHKNNIFSGDKSYIRFTYENNESKKKYAKVSRRFVPGSTNEIYLSNNIVYFPSGIDDTKKVTDEFVKTFYNFLKNKDYRPSEVKEHFHKYMQEIFDGLDLTFKYSHLDKEDNVWFTNDNEEEFEIKDLSTGEKTLLSKILYIYFKDYKDKVILIDEPELSLHPSWQNKILSVYEKLAKKNNCQIIIATHSPHIIGSAKPEYLRVLKKVEDTIEVVQYTQSYGFEFDKILTDIMGVENIRTPDVAKDIRKLWNLLEDENYESVEYTTLYSKLEKDLGDLDKDLVLARLEVARIKSRNAKSK